MLANRKRWAVVADPLDFDDELHVAALHAWEKVWLDDPSNRYWLRSSAVVAAATHHSSWGHLLRFRPERVNDSWRT